MPTYQYEALNEAGQTQKGTISAASSDDAVARIRSQGMFPSLVREQKVKKARTPDGKGTPGAGAAKNKKKWNEMTLPSLGGVSGKLLTTFTRQFSTLQDAGLPILRSIAILEQQQKPGLMKTTLMGVHEDVASGLTLSDAMAKHPKAFDKLYTKMIAAGEVGGVLDQILQRLADFMEKSAKLKKKIIGAMIYPAVVVAVAVIIVTGIMILIVPKFKKIFEDFDTELPAMTSMLIKSSAWLGGSLLGSEGNPDQLIPGIVWVVLSPIFIWVGLKLVRKSEYGKAVLDKAVLKVPVMGPLISMSSIARFTRTLGTLIRAGVPILDAITITRDTTANYTYQVALSKVHESVRQGDSFAEPLRQTKVCDSIVVNMIDVGEETGELDQMLLKIADNYDEEVDNMVAAMTSLIEPIMVVGLGGMVGFIVIALFLPLVKLIESVS